MSHRALVLAPSSHGDGLVDIYVSRNGAYQLKLWPILDAHVNAPGANLPKDVSDIPDTVSESVDAVRESFGEKSDEFSMIEPTPEKRGVPVTQVGEEIDFVRFEAVYLVTDSLQGWEDEPAVVPYLPVFVDVAIGLFFMRFITFEVYDNTKLSSDHQEALDQIDAGDVAPTHSCERAEYLDLPDDPEAFEFFVDTHVGILQTLYSLSATGGRDTALATIITEDTWILGRVDISGEFPLPDPVGSGMLVRLPVEDFTYDQLSNLYRDWENLANRMRAETALSTARDFITVAEPDALDEFNPEAYHDQLVADLTQEFASSISSLTSDEYLEVRD